MNLPLPCQLNLVCRTCRRGRGPAFSVLPFLTTGHVKQRSILSSRNISVDSPRRSKRPPPHITQTPSLPLRSNSTGKEAATFSQPDLSDPASTLDRLISDTKRIRSSPTIPDELDVLEALETSRQLSEKLIYGETDPYVTGAGDAQIASSPTSSILGLDEWTRESARPPLQMSPSFRKQASTALAKTLHHLLCDPKIHISLPMLQVYVRIQVLLGKPEFLPEIFHLYAHKPIPFSSQSALFPPSSSSTPSPSTSSRASTQDITFRRSSPNHPRNVIPPELASAALTSAIALKSLPLALSIMETTVATPSYRRAKFLYRALTPLSFLSLTPFCAYTISTYVAYQWQNTYDPGVATWLCTAGIMAYVATTATLGFVAVTTSNDQMERVTWRPGTRLRDRWLREEERAAFDRIALAWGFKEKWRRGEERGEDWEALREFCARRGMILDKTELLEGME